MRSQSSATSCGRRARHSWRKHRYCSSYSSSSNISTSCSSSSCSSSSNSSCSSKCICSSSNSSSSSSSNTSSSSSSSSSCSSSNSRTSSPISRSSRRASSSSRSTRSAPARRCQVGRRGSCPRVRRCRMGPSALVATSWKGLVLAAQPPAMLLVAWSGATASLWRSLPVMVDMAKGRTRPRAWWARCRCWATRRWTDRRWPSVRRCQPTPCRSRSSHSPNCPPRPSP
mmetsp:Transcript_28326/g.82067  ORF Transcript_28326/g.82067 Transcript_28326/m.82067 type:complete len:227 (-) Transcript_28326:925-1605(-)